MVSATGDRVTPFNGTPGVAASPDGDLVAFLITGDDQGASGLTLADYKFLLRLKTSLASATNVTLEDFAASNVYVGWEGVFGQEVYNAVMRRGDITGFEKSAARWRSVYGGLIEDITFDGGGSEGEPFQIGMHFEQCGDIIVRRVRGRNCAGRDAADRPYYNGDIFATEGNARNMTFEDCWGDNPLGDGVFDLKGLVKLVGLIEASRGWRNLRLWDGADASLATIHSKFPRGQHIWTEGRASSTDAIPPITIGKLIAEGSNGATAVCRNEDGPADWTINDYELTGCAGLVLHWNTFGMPIKFPYGGHHTGADGVRRFYPGAPPTGTGGVLL